MKYAAVSDRVIDIIHNSYISVSLNKKIDFFSTNVVIILLHFVQIYLLRFQNKLVTVSQVVISIQELLIQIQKKVCSEFKTEFFIIFCTLRRKINMHYIYNLIQICLDLGLNKWQQIFERICFKNILIYFKFYSVHVLLNIVINKFSVNH